MFVLNIKREEAIFRDNFNIPEELFEYLCERVNTVYNTAMDEEDKMQQLAYLVGFITALKGRLNRVYEKI